MGVRYNLSVKVGSYTDRNGNEKNKWLNVGVVLDGKYGPYIMLNKTFNPAGVPSDPDRDSILISLFKPNADFGPKEPESLDNTAALDDEVVF